MASKVLKSGENSEVEALARSIMDSQDAEIEKMLAWLRARGLSRDASSGGMGGM